MLKFYCTLTTISFLHGLNKPSVLSFQAKDETLNGSHFICHVKCLLKPRNLLTRFLSLSNADKTEHACDHRHPLGVLLIVEEKSITLAIIFCNLRNCLLVEDFHLKSFPQFFPALCRQGLLLCCSQLYSIIYRKCSPSISVNEPNSNLFMLIILLADKRWNV